MAGFEAFRNDHGFTQYKDNRTAVMFDMPLVAVTYFCVLVSIATLIATLGIRGRQRWSSAIRACYAVAIGSIILACLVGHGWQTGEVGIRSSYVYRQNLPFEGTVGINVALNDANVTLEGYYYGSSGSGYVYYAESMPWSDYGHGSDSYAYFLHRGLPDPILKVMEFLTVDGGDLRWGRAFHTGGHFAKTLLWTSFAFWIVTNVLLFSVIVYGAYMFFMTGLTMILACVAYHACQNSQPLVISFGDDDLRISYGWSFWLALVSGMITLLLGLILIILDHFAHEDVHEFFHLEKLSDDDLLECEDIRERGNSLLMDRRGSLMPPLSERRGSIFLFESTRKASTGWYSDVRQSLAFMTGKSALTGSKSMENLDLAGPSKVNPIYGQKLSVPNSDYEDVRIDMERVCQDPPEVCLSTKKASLATLKEHRENHENEKRSTSGSPFNKEIRSGSVQESVPTFRMGGQEILRKPVINLRRESCPGITLSPADLQRQTSTASYGFGLPAEGNKNVVEVNVESYIRQSSNESTTSSTGSGTSSLDSGHGVSGDICDASGSGSRSSLCGSKRNSISDNTDVVINVQGVDKKD